MSSRLVSLRPGEVNAVRTALYQMVGNHDKAVAEGTQGFEPAYVTVARDLIKEGVFDD